jgi:predicted membrane chloride channel (bestrophin family)
MCRARLHVRQFGLRLMPQYDRHNWVRHLFTLKGSVLPVVVPRILVFAGLSMPVVVAHKFGWAPTITPTIHAALGTVLGLMLSWYSYSLICPFFLVA